MTRLAIAEWGGGDRVAVLVHGLSARAEIWEAVAAPLAERGYRVIAPDLSGHGRSPRGAYSVVEWVEDLIGNVPAAPELAVGHSLGGIVLVEAVARLRPAHAVYIDPPWRAAGDPLGFVPQFEARKALTHDAIAAANPRWTPREIDLRHEGFAMWDAATARAFGVTRRPDYTPLERPRQPSLLALPETSPLVPLEDAARLLALGWSVRTFSGTGHYIHLDDRSAFLECLFSWLA